MCLYENALAGTIPELLASMPFLSALNIGSNDLSGSVPDSVASIPQLTSFIASSNKLSGSIGAAISRGLSVGIISPPPTPKSVGVLSEPVGNILCQETLFVLSKEVQFLDCIGSDSSSGLT